VGRAERVASNAKIWLNTLIAHAKTGKEERDAEAKELESALAKEPVDVPVDLTGAPSVENMFCITYHSP
jgi:hypothetical protein